MYTAMALVALTVGSLSGTPAWQNDYKAAQSLVSVAGKPMAVFIGSGQAGYESAVRDGFDPAVSKLLAEKFVCLYVDTATTKGKILAAAFQVGDRGVVLSDREGKGQVYSASGTITRDELNRALITYQDVQVAQKTDAPKPAAPAAGGAVLAPGQGASGAMMAGPGGPMMAPPPAPYYGGGYAMGGYGGGCGNCGGGCGGNGCGSGCGWGGGCGMSKGCCFFGGCNKGYGCGTPCAAPAPCAPAPCNTGCGGGYSKGCCFLGGLCGFGHGGGCGWGGGCGGCGGGWGGGCCH